MKKLLLATAIIVAITACAKHEASKPEPEPVPESYVGYLRSEHPNLKISGISVNDTIICDIKSARSFCWGLENPNPETDLFVEPYTYEDIREDINTLLPKATIYLYGNRLTQLTIFDGKEKMCEIVDITGKDLQLTENIVSFKVKDMSFVLDAKNYKANTCGFDVEVTMTNGDVIEVVYYGISVPLTISGRIK